MSLSTGELNKCLKCSGAGWVQGPAHPTGYNHLKCDMCEGTGKATVKNDSVKSDVDFESSKVVPEDVVEEVSEGDRLMKFFFPKKESPKYTLDCTCGLDSITSGGRHSSWCPKSKFDK